MAYSTRGVSMDFNTLNKYGVDSCKKIVQRSIAKAVKRKNIQFDLNKENLGYWDDASGDQFRKSFDNFSTAMSGEGDVLMEKDAEDLNSSKVNDASDEEEDSKNSSQPTDLLENSEELSLHPEKDSELDSTTSSPIVDKPSVVPKKSQTDKVIQKNKALASNVKMRKKAISAELKAKQEEEKLLKQEHDMLEYKVNKTQELQDSIDKYREKIRTLKNANLVRKSLNSKLRSKRIQ